MNKVQKEEETRIVGISIETGGEHAAGEIGQLWGRAHASGLITDPSAPTFGVYYAYTDAQATRYRVLVGQESQAPLPVGGEEIMIPKGDYMVLADKGAVSEKVGGMWKQAWTTLRSERTMKVDFERYVGGPDAAEIELFLSA